MMQDKCDVSNTLTAIRTPVAVVSSPRGPYAVCYDRARATTLNSDPNCVLALMAAMNSRRSSRLWSEGTPRDAEMLPEIDRRKSALRLSIRYAYMLTSTHALG